MRFKVGATALTLSLFIVFGGFIYDSSTMFMDRPWYGLGDQLMAVGTWMLWVSGLVIILVTIWRKDTL